jgi:hypothetical protein
MRFVNCLFGIASFLFLSSAAQAAYIVNGDFGTGDFTGWSAGGHVEVVEITYTYNNVPYFAAGFNRHDSTPDAILSQTFHTTAGHQYDLSFGYGVFSYEVRGGRCELIE